MIHPLMESIATALYIGKNILTEELLNELCAQLKTVMIADTKVADLYGIKISKLLNTQLLTLPSGEKAKTKEIQEEVIDALFKMGAGKDTALIALGGGATTDLVAFVASIYMRGIPLILIPTTLLAMVDGAIGKTAINTSFGKNLIGTIYHPKAVLVSVETLETLPEQEWFNGLAEILKMGLIYDPDICPLVQKNRKDPELIVQAIKGKISIVEQDPLERHLRRILNFGHTIGHGLEGISHYEIPHGQAVAIGSLVEAHLSMSLGYFSEKEFEEIQELYNVFSLHLHNTYHRQHLLKALSYDKKSIDGKIRFVLIDKIGHALPFGGMYCRPVSLDELEPSLVWMEKNYG